VTSSPLLDNQRLATGHNTADPPPVNQFPAPIDQLHPGRGNVNRLAGYGGRQAISVFERLPKRLGMLGQRPQLRRAVNLGQGGFEVRLCGLPAGQRFRHLNQQFADERGGAQRSGRFNPAGSGKRLLAQLGHQFLFNDPD
jgi:hypothetical protein